MTFSIISKPLQEFLYIYNLCRKQNKFNSLWFSYQQWFLISLYEILSGSIKSTSRSDTLELYKHGSLHEALNNCFTISRDVAYGPQGTCWQVSNKNSRISRQEGIAEFALYVYIANKFTEISTLWSMRYTVIEAKQHNTHFLELGTLCHVHNQAPHGA